MKTISFAHQKGGVGKSSLCFNAAGYLIKKGKVRIGDLDVQETSTNQNFLRAHNNLEPFEVQTATSNEELLKLYQKAQKDKVDFLLIDCGGFDADINRVAIAFSDVVIIPVSTRPVEMFGLGKFTQILKEIECDAGKKINAVVVINNIHPSLKDIKIIEDLCLSQENKPLALAKSKVRNRAVFVNASAIGATVFELKKEAKLAQEEIKQMCNEVILN